jgi:hypothetical protein
VCDTGRGRREGGDLLPLRRVIGWVGAKGRERGGFAQRLMGAASCDMLS